MSMIRVIKVDKQTIFIASLIVFFVIFFFSTGKVRAAFSMSILDIDPQIAVSNEQEIIVTATISGLPNPSFFRVAWQKSSGASYFGYVKNNSGDWVKIQSDQDCKNYYSVVDTNTNNLVLITKIGDDNVPENGTYTLKVRRYTSTCGSNSDSDPISIEISLPTPVPAPEPTPVPTVVSTPVPTPIPTKTSSPLPTKTPTSKPKLVKTPSPSPEAVFNTETPEVVPTPTVLGVSIEQNDKKSFPILAIVLIGVGVLMVGFAVYNLLHAEVVEES